MFVVYRLQAVYLKYDADSSGTISADELPKAFNAAGKKMCVFVFVRVCVFV